MRPPKLRPSRSICRRVMAFRILSNNDRPPVWILKIVIFDLMTVIAVLTCCCVPNSIKIGSRVRPPNAHNCWMSIAPLLGPLLGNGRCHGNPILADMSGTWWDATSQVSFLKILIFDHVTVIVVLICCCVPNYIKIGSRVRPPDAHNCWIYNAPLLGNGCCHGNVANWDGINLHCDRKMHPVSFMYKLQQIQTCLKACISFI